jgi:hypothetical protein
MKIKLLFSLSITLIFFICCHNTIDKEAINIKGPWFFVRNDSIYEEMIFGHDRFFTYDENSGVYIGYYELANDSLFLFDHYRKITLAGRINSVAIDKFSLESRHYSTIFHRLSLGVDTTLIFREDENYLNDYVRQYYIRREKIRGRVK